MFFCVQCCYPRDRSCLVTLNRPNSSSFSHFNPVFLQRPPPLSQISRTKCRLKLGQSINSLQLTVYELSVAEMSLRCRSSSRKSRSCLLRTMPNCHPFSTSSAQPPHPPWNCTRKPWPTSTKVGFAVHWRRGYFLGAVNEILSHTLPYREGSGMGKEG